MAQDNKKPFDPNQDQAVILASENAAKNKARLDEAFANIAKPQKVDVPVAAPTNTYQDMYNKFFDTPMDKAEEERRKRAATHVNAVQHLGNAMNAFGNLLFTGQSAPSQTLPTVANPDLQVYSDKARAARNQYAEAMAKAKSLDDASNRQKVADRNAAIAQNNNVEQNNLANTLSRLKMEGAIDDSVIAAINKSNERNDKKEQQEKENQYKQQTLAQGYAKLKMEGEKHKAQMEQISDAKYTRMLNGDGTLLQIPNANINASTVLTVYNLLSEEDKKKAETMYGWKTSVDSLTGKETTTRKALDENDMLYAIGAFIQNSPDAQKALQSLGAIYSKGYVKPPVMTEHPNNDEYVYNTPWSKQSQGTEKKKGFSLKNNTNNNQSFSY